MCAFLSACSGEHESVKAVDRVEDAEKRALAAAPEAAVIEFSDEGEAPMLIETDEDVANDDTNTATNDVAAASGDIGKARYEKTCKTCHETGLAGAPKFGDKGDWSAHISKGKDTLYNNAINGTGAMPAKGGAADADDAEIHAAVDYMLAQVQ